MNPLVQSHVLSHDLNGLVKNNPTLCSVVAEICANIEQQHDISVLRDSANVNAWIKPVNVLASGRRYSTLRLHAKTIILAAIIAKFFDLYTLDDYSILKLTMFDLEDFEFQHGDIYEEIKSEDARSLRVEGESNRFDVGYLRQREIDRLAQLQNRFRLIFDKQDGLGLDHTGISEAIIRAVWLLYENETFRGNGSHASRMTKRRYKLFYRNAGIQQGDIKRGKRKVITPTLSPSQNPGTGTRRQRRRTDVLESESDDNSLNQGSIGLDTSRQPWIAV